MVKVATDIHAGPDYGRSRDTDMTPAAVHAGLMPWSWVAVHVTRVCVQVQQQHRAQAPRIPQAEGQILGNSVPLRGKMGHRQNGSAGTQAAVGRTRDPDLVLGNNPGWMYQAYLDLRNVQISMAKIAECPPNTSISASPLSL